MLLESSGCKTRLSSCKKLSKLLFTRGLKDYFVNEASWMP